MSTTTLLPCPFCGREARISHSGDGELCNIRCTGWNPGDCLGAGPNCYSVDEAVAGWNRRAQQLAIMPKGESAAAQLRAMATNYPPGHSWDKLDAKACIRGALEIEALRAQLATATGLPAQADDPAAGFEMWWAEYMPEATQAQAFKAWTAPQAQADARDAVTQAVRDYYFALDTRQHGGAAASTALDAIQKALGLNWVQGAEASARASMATSKGE